MRMQIEAKHRDFLTRNNTRFDNEPEGGAFLIFNSDFGKIGDADYVNTIIGEIATGNGRRFNGLIDRTRANGLNLCAGMFPHDTSNSTRNRRRP